MRYLWRVYSIGQAQEYEVSSDTQPVSPLDPPIGAIDETQTVLLGEDPNYYANFPGLIGTGSVGSTDEQVAIGDHDHSIASGYSQVSHDNLYSITFAF